MAVYFLLHFPPSHLDWALPSDLPYGARTFLQWKSPPANTLGTLTLCNVTLFNEIPNPKGALIGLVVVNVDSPTGIAN